MAKIRPPKADTHRNRLTVGGKLSHSPADVTTPTAALITAKIIFNSVTLTKSARFMCAYIAKFYLNNPMDIYEYMKLPLDIIPKEIFQQYKLRKFRSQGFCIYGNPKRHVWATPCRKSFK